VSNTSELQSLLDNQPQPDCAKLTPFVVEQANFETGHVKLRFAAQPAFKNHFGNVQGGFAVALIDALVSVSAFAKTRAWLPTVEIKSSFLAPIKLGECVGEASIIKAGKQLMFLEARLWGADGTLAVHATATTMGPQREPPSAG